jgi:hypothetical protein
VLIQDIVIDDKVVGYGKAVKQIAYSEILDAGHFLPHDQPRILSTLFKKWVDSLSE